LKKFLILFLLLAGGLHLHAFEVHAETLEYPFDEIRIVEAFKFEIVITQTPNALSIFFDVVQVNDVLTVYIGTLVLVDQGVENQSQTKILILSTAEDVDLARWIINSGSWSETEEWLEFSNPIQINPTIGVVKDLSIPLIQIGYRKDVVNTTFTFYDNTGALFTMVEDSLVIETGLSILISAYVPVGEAS